MNRLIRTGIGILIAAAAILIAGLLMPLSIEQEAGGKVDCGTALSFDAEFKSAGGESCEDAATDRRTLVYLLAGAIGGVGLILLGFGSPQTGDRRRRHCQFRQLRSAESSRPFGCTRCATIYARTQSKVCRIGRPVRRDVGCAETTAVPALCCR